MSIQIQRPLSVHHQQLLDASAISPAIVAGRGYWTAETKQEIRQLGFTNAQSLPPALVVPLYDANGTQKSVQIRPDRPRTGKRGNVLKYENPSGSSVVIDVHPAVRDAARGHDDILVLTEGVRKADSAISHGLVAVDFSGVYNWRGRNRQGGLTSLDDWEYLDLKERSTIIAFDSDAIENPQVWWALKRLRQFLLGRGARVKIAYLPAADDGGKVGLDDFFAAGHSKEAFLAMAEEGLRPCPASDKEPGIPVEAFDLHSGWEQLLVPRPYFLRENATGLEKPVDPISGEADERIAESPVLITGIYRDAEEGTEHLRLEWKRRGRWDELIANRGVIMETRRLVVLAEQGLPVATDNAKSLVTYLRKFEAVNLERLPVSPITSHLGHQGSGGFLWGGCWISAGGDSEDDEVVSFHGGAAGDDQIARGYRAHGIMAEWLQAVAMLAAHPRAQIAFYTSFVPPLLAILQAKNFVVDLANRTSTGKTTALRVAASVWGQPDEQGEDPAIWTWDATPVRLDRLCAIISDLPVLLDDTQRAKDPQRIARTIYAVCSGQSRGRGTLGGVERTRAWRTVLLSSGEGPITSFSEDGGTRTRVLLIRGAPFGPTGEAERQEIGRLNRSLFAHYGFAGPAFVRWLLDRREEWEGFRHLYQSTAAVYAEEAKTAEGGRLAEYVAAVIIAGQLVHQAIDLPWEFTDPFAGIWDEIMGEAGEAAAEVRFCERLGDWAYAHQRDFCSLQSHERDQPTNGWAGRWDRELEWEWVAFFPNLLRQLCKEWGYSYDAVAAGWKERGWTKTDGKHLDAHVRLPGGDKRRLVVLLREAVENPRGSNLPDSDQEEKDS